MKNLLIFLILFSNSILQLKAQNYFEEFGKISQEQIDMTKCSYDPAADAIVLFDVGKSSFVRVENGFDVVFERITRIKILNDAGKDYAEVAIPFYQEGNIYEKVEITKASTYTIADGRITKISTLDPAKCYEEKINENWKSKKFAMPNVQAGSIIEYKYRIQSQYHFNLRDWEFQWNIPVLYSAYEVRMIPFYEYTWYLQGRNAIDELKQYEDNTTFKQDFLGTSFYDVVHKFGLKNVPAFVNEEYTPSRENDIIKIDFQLSAFFHLDGVKVNIMTTWPELVNDYAKNANFGKYVKKSAASASKIFDPDSLDGKTQLQKFNYIVDYAKDNFNWNEYYRQFADKSPAELQKDKIGNSAEINLWLVGAFQEAGIEAYPVILSTRKHGKIRSDYPFSSSFNSVIAFAMVDGKQMLADATDPYCPNNKISIQNMNDKGLLVDKDNMKWFSLQSPGISGLSTSIKIDSIGKDQQATVIVTAMDYEALYYRNLYANNHENMLSDLSKKMYLVDDASLKFKNETDRTRPFSFMYNLDRKTEIINDKIYLQPFLNEVFSENPLKQKTRTYPVDMTYPVKRIYKSEIKIPEGFKVEFLPAVSSLNDDLFELDYFVAQNESSVTVSLTYAFKHSVYSPEEYSRVKTMFDRIVKKGSEKIVLVRL